MRKITYFLLMILFLSSCKTKPQTVETINIDVIEPVFEVVSIVIIRAELINTQFEATLKIENPNEFDVELSSINYELHGNGMFWADGAKSDILHIPAQSSQEVKFRFIMNFIDMNRKLLDDVIAMRQVQYRFKGAAQIQASSLRIAPFTMDFDCSGFSEVIPDVETESRVREIPLPW